MKSKVCKFLLLTKCAKCGIISPGRARALRPEFDKNLTYGKFSVESAGLSIWPKISRKCGHRLANRTSPHLHMAHRAREASAYPTLSIALHSSLAARIASGKLNKISLSDIL